MLSPIKDLIWLKPDEYQTVTPGGIRLPDVAKVETGKATVRAVGPDVKSVRPGDRVIYNKQYGQFGELDGEELMFVKEEHLFAKLEETVVRKIGIALNPVENDQDV
jgi:chaperonin GroES